MTKREMMIEAHKMAKQMVGDYVARLALALRTLWAAAKKGAAKITKAIENLAGTGSEKQIAWATDIINQNLTTLEKELQYFKDRSARGGGDFPELMSKIEKGICELKNSSYPAKYWIEHRNLANYFLQKIKKH